MPITWKNINIPSNEAGLAAATAGLNQLARSINSGIDIYAKREADRNQQAIDDNVALFQRRLREIDINNPEEVAALENQLKSNAALFGNQTDELFTAIGNERTRREEQRLLDLNRQVNLDSANFALARNAARPYLETVNELQTKGDYAGIKNYLGIGVENATPEQQAEYEKRREALRTAGEYDTVLGVVRKGDIFEATTALFNEESTPEEMTALLEQQFNGLTPEEKALAQSRINDMVQFRDNEGVHSSDAKFIAEQKQKYLGEFEGRLRDLDRMEEELAAYRGMIANPELAEIFTKTSKPTPTDFATVAKLLPVKGDADYEEMGDDLHAVYTELLNEHKGKISAEQLKNLMLDSLTNPGVINVPVFGDNSINKKTLKTYIEDGLINIDEKLTDYRKLKSIQEERQDIQNSVNERVKELVDAASENYTKYKVGKLKGKAKEPYKGFDFSKVDLSTPSVAEIARDLVKSGEDAESEKPVSTDEAAAPPRQTNPLSGQYWPNVRW